MDLAKEFAEEMGRLVEEGSSVLHMEVSHSQSENEALRRKLLQMESQWSGIRAAGEDTQHTGSDGPPRSPAVQFWKLKGAKVSFQAVSEDELSPTDSPCGIGEAAVVVEEDCPLQSVPTTQLYDMAARTEKGRLKFLLKAQRLEKEMDGSDPQGALKISEEKVMGCSASAGGKPRVELQPCDVQLDTRLTPAGSSQELDAQPTPVQLNSDVKDEDGERVSVERNMKTRRRVGKGEELFGCMSCGKTFGTQGHLKEHQVLRGGENTVGCTLCGQDFAAKCSFRLHRRTAHEGEKRFGCTSCGKIFARKSVLKAHQVLHTGEKAFRCSQCGKSFTTRRSLNVHGLTVHKGEKPHGCEECGKSYSQKSALKIHRRLHTGEKPYGCTDCGKSFCNKSALKRHQRVHTGEKAFSCGKCGKSFSLSENLNRHQRIHTGEKAHNCNVRK